MIVYLSVFQKRYLRYLTKGMRFFLHFCCVSHSLSLSGACLIDLEKRAVLHSLQDHACKSIMVRFFSVVHPSDLAAEKKGDRELGKSKSMLLTKI